MQDLRAILLHHANATVPVFRIASSDWSGGWTRGDGDWSGHPPVRCVIHRSIQGIAADGYFAALCLRGLTNAHG